MHHNYQQFDLQTLIDLLAAETEKYTKAFISGNSQISAQHRASIDALVEEIHSRKQEAILKKADQNDVS
jgi:hypothetical protein